MHFPQMYVICSLPSAHSLPLARSCTEQVELRTKLNRQTAGGQHGCNCCYLFLLFVNMVLCVMPHWTAPERQPVLHFFHISTGGQTHRKHLSPEKQARLTKRNSSVCSSDVCVCFTAIQREHLSVTRGARQVEMRAQRETDPPDAASSSILMPGREG